MNTIKKAEEHFGRLIQEELLRISAMHEKNHSIDYTALSKIIIGILPGDGIGPIIMEQAVRILKALLGDEIEKGHIELRYIKGMTIENRAAKNESLPEDALKEIKQCHVLLKGPMTTPRPGDPWPNLVSANSLLRRHLDLFAAVRPIQMPAKQVDWTFFRENIEGEYLWGNKGIQVNEDLAVDFRVQTKLGSERVARAAFDFARKNGKTNVTVITKNNIVKLTDGNFVKAINKVAEEYPEINVEERLVDVTAAKLTDEEFTKGLQVFVLPNLYGDIVTDIAAELQGGLGTSASSNLGTQYAMFEAIHGTAPFLIEHGRGEYANPCSLIRAVGMLLAHIGYNKSKQALDKALDICTITEKKKVVTTFKEDASAQEFTDYLLNTLQQL